MTDNFSEINGCFEFLGSYYVIDMEKFMKFVSFNTSSEKESETTITQIFSNTDDDTQDTDTPVELKAISKEITEKKPSHNSEFSGIRYDFARILLNAIFTPIISSDNGNIVVDDESNMSLGQKLAFNTFLRMGIIYEINKEHE